MIEEWIDDLQSYRARDSHAQLDILSISAPESRRQNLQKPTVRAYGSCVTSVLCMIVWPMEHSWSFQPFQYFKGQLLRSPIQALKIASVLSPNSIVPWCHVHWYCFTCDDEGSGAQPELISLASTCIQEDKLCNQSRDRITIAGRWHRTPRRTLPTYTREAHHVTSGNYYDSMDHTQTGAWFPIAGIVQTVIHPDHV